MKPAPLILITISVLFFNGCASQNADNNSGKYPVIFDSYPQGAALICNGKELGYTPKILYYENDFEGKEVINLSNCSANWVSGARKDYGIVDIKQSPEGAKQVLQRPDFPGYKKDAKFAFKERIKRSMKQQSKSAYQQEKRSEQCFTSYGDRLCL